MASKELSGFLLAARSGDFLILDTETTGLHEAEIVQIAIINQDGYVLLDTLVHPVNPIPVEATGVHGIDDEMVAYALPWELVWADVVNLLAGRRVIAYGAAFDCRMLLSATAVSGLEGWDWLSSSEWYCAMKAFAEVHGAKSKWKKSFKWQTLSAACKYFGKTEPQMHTALSDCNHTLFLVESMAALPLS